VNYPTKNGINLKPRVHLEIVLEINSPEMIFFFEFLDCGNIRKVSEMRVR
jgi:hypothetical protein